MNLLNTLYGTTGLSMLTFQQTIMIIVALFVATDSFWNAFS